MGNDSRWEYVMAAFIAYERLFEGALLFTEISLSYFAAGERLEEKVGGRKTCVRNLLVSIFCRNRTELLRREMIYIEDVSGLC